MTAQAVRQTVGQLPTVNDAGLFMDTVNAAKYLGVSHATMCRLCASGQVPAMRVGRLWRIPVSWVAEQLGVVADEG